MLTVVHAKYHDDVDGEQPCFGVRDSSGIIVNFDAVLYVIGERPPNYPVPAIRKPEFLDDTSSFEYWAFHGWLQAQGYRTKP